MLDFISEYNQTQSHKDKHKFMIRFSKLLSNARQFDLSLLKRLLGFLISLLSTGRTDPTRRIEKKALRTDDKFDCLILVLVLESIDSPSNII
jgi:hypothetical protein